MYYREIQFCISFKYRVFISLNTTIYKDGRLILSILTSIKPKGDSSMKLGQILLRKHIIAPQQLEEAIREQDAYPLKLGEILIQKGWLAPQALQEALKEQNWRKKGFWII
jgi:hypothetical protein